MVCTRGGQRIITVEPLPEVPETLALDDSVRYAPTRVMDGIKSLSYGANMLATRLAKEQGGDEALLVTPHGRVLEGPRQSFFASLDGETLVTPPLDDHVLDSITRRRLIESGARERAPDLRRRAAVRPGGVPRLDDARGPPGALDRRRRAAGRARAAHAAAAAALHEVIAAAVRQPRGMRVVTVIGNRPQFVKAAAVSRLLRERARRAARPHRPALRRRAVGDLRRASSASRRPSASWGSAAGSNTEQTARMLAALGPLLAESAPDAVLVYGDTNSTLAGSARRGAGADPRRARRGRDALVRPRDARGAQPRPHRPRVGPAAVPVAGRRAATCEREGVAGRVELVGDVMVDVAELVQPARERRRRAAARGRREPGEYVLVTAHRAGNVDDPERLRRSSSCCSRFPGRSSSRCTRARARGSMPRACWRGSSRG